MWWRGCNLTIALASALGCGGKAQRDLDGVARGEPCELMEQRLTSENAWPEPDEAPALAWNGEGYGLSWMDYGSGISALDFNQAGIYFARVDTAGDIVVPAHLVIEDAASIPALSWTGDGYALLSASTSVYLSRLDLAGALLGESVLVSEAVGPWDVDPELDFTGDGFGAAWLEHPDLTFRSHFARLGASGNVLDETLISPGVGRSIDARLVWTGDGFGLVWADDRTGALEIYFAELDVAGNRRFPETQVSNTAHEASNPQLVWVGDGYGVAWLEYVSDDDERVHFERVGRTGQSISPDVEWQGRLIGMVWTGTEFAIAVQRRSQMPSSLSLVLFDVRGARTKERLITMDWTGYVWTAIAWGGDRLALASVEDGGIVFRLASCP